MAKMKALAPRMTNLRETYKDDREKLNRAMMELYQREKVNPLAGCLPMVIQIPVFLAFYWVLRDSVEMRQAPFMLWINDLSVARSVLRAARHHGGRHVHSVQDQPAGRRSGAAEDLHDHAAGHVGDVRLFPGRPGVVLGDQHPSVDPAAVEHQPSHRGGEPRKAVNDTIVAAATPPGAAASRSCECRDRPRDRIATSPAGDAAAAASCQPARFLATRSATRSITASRSTFRRRTPIPASTCLNCTVTAVRCSSKR